MGYLQHMCSTLHVVNSLQEAAAEEPGTWCTVVFDYFEFAVVVSKRCDSKLPFANILLISFFFFFLFPERRLLDLSERKRESETLQGPGRLRGSEVPYWSEEV